MIYTTYSKLPTDVGKTSTVFQQILESLFTDLNHNNRVDVFDVKAMT